MADGIVEYVLRLKDQTKQGTASAVTGSKRLEDQTEKTTRAVDDLGDEAVQTSKQLDRMGKESTSAARAQSGLSRGLSGAVTGAGRLLSSVGGLTTAIGAAGLAGATTAAVVSFRAAAQEVADLRNDIADASTRSGIATDTLQGLRLAAEGAGLQLAALTSGLDQFGRRVSDAARGGNATAEAFAELGVSVTDANGDIRDGDAVLRETLAALNAMEPSAQRSALAVETLGRAGGRLLQALSGSELDSFVALADEFGVGVGPRAAQSAGEWQRAVAELGVVLDGVKGQLVDAFGGGANLVFDLSEAVVISVEVIKGALSGFTTGISNIADDIIAPFQSLLDVLAGINRALDEAAKGNYAAAASAAADAAVAAGKALAQAPSAALTATGGLTGALPGLAADTLIGAQAGLEAGQERAERLRELRAATGAAQRAPDLGDGGGGDGGGQESASRVFASGFTDPEAVATEAAVAASRVFASGFTEDRRRLSDVLAEGAENLAEQVEKTAAAAAESRARTLGGVSTGIGVGTSVLQGNIGGALGQAGRAVGSAGLSAAASSLGVAGAVVSGLQFIGEQGAEGISDTLNGVKDSLVAALEALPELIGDVLPDFAVALIRDLIPALIEASPQIFYALLVELPGAIGDAVAKAIGVESEAGKGAIRGGSIGAVIGGVVGGVTLGLLTGGVATGAGIKLGAAGGGAIGAVVGAIASGRSSRSSDAARTATDGQAATARESDRLAQVSIRPRRQKIAVRQNPYDTLARQYDAQYGTLGRASSTTIGAT